ncbi:hypothetical protein F5984_15125 [Rudanella paleaurantiibacter]|uniref:Uncharacterized protein n=1 Tax=Rudanella paleaurantiibacter TaxID=2614655 RepID=A0A7J5TZA5_9BACT|nr:hypothetical protein [Rudanella paleaurantiibacter]KAB7730472.1 hypothetical protein F5984_15125 [Rudanella paleaurantiibacter]
MTNQNEHSKAKSLLRMMSIHQAGHLVMSVLEQSKYSAGKRPIKVTVTENAINKAYIEWSQNESRKDPQHLEEPELLLYANRAENAQLCRPYIDEPELSLHCLLILAGHAAEDIEAPAEDEEILSRVRRAFEVSEMYGVENDFWEAKRLLLGKYKDCDDPSEYAITAGIHLYSEAVDILSTEPISAAVRYVADQLEQREELEGVELDRLLAEVEKMVESAHLILVWL